MSLLRLSNALEGYSVARDPRSSRCRRINVDPVENVLGFVESLIQEGRSVEASQFAPAGNWIVAPPRRVDLRAFRKWEASCRLLAGILGQFEDTWPVLTAPTRDNRLSEALSLLATLEAIQDNLRAGRLVRFADLAVAGVFADLHSQAEYLVDQGYYLAGGVLFRAVLEEKLRKMRRDSATAIEKARPTIADLNSALYKNSVYDKVTLKHVEAMAAVGNDAAHAAPHLQADDVARFGRDLSGFLTRFGA
jgi:hypothetical protein